MPPGRPSDYDPEYCTKVLDLGKKGKSRVEIAYELDVGTTTLQRWEAAHEDFRVAMARAKEAEQVWWERKGRRNLQAQHFQASMWSRSMAARFPNDWREKLAHVGGAKDDEPIRQEITLDADAFTRRILGAASRSRDNGTPGEPAGTNEG
jgi:hypothetical protein